MLLSTLRRTARPAAARCLSATPRKVNLAAAFAGIDEPWSPKVAGDINECQVKLARMEGEFVWHHHEEEDELFLVVRGRMRMCVAARCPPRRALPSRARVHAGSSSTRM